MHKSIRQRRAGLWVAIAYGGKPALPDSNHPPIPPIQACRMACRPDSRHAAPVSAKSAVGHNLPPIAFSPCGGMVRPYILMETVLGGFHHICRAGKGLRMECVR